MSSIKQKLKICKICKKLTYIFSKGRCMNCSKKSYGKNPKTTKENTRVSKWTKCRKEYIASERKKGTLYCFFCGIELYKQIDVHHLRGRVGELLTDKRYLVLAHNYCHVSRYHSLDSRKLKELRWYSGFMGRLKEKDIKSYDKENNKC